MSFLVELAQGAYPPQALKQFKAIPPFLSENAFNSENALAMMWMAQLAYETAHEQKVTEILKSWNLTKLVLASNDPITGFPPHSACVVVAGGLNATIVAFSGTDPLKIEDWITDFTVNRTASDLHKGFDDAVTAVWPLIEAAIKNRPADQKELFFTGHSLGGALATIAAARALRDPEMVATAVYTFGGPRVGGSKFSDDYTPKLGNRTYRLVHGGDIVPTVPPAAGEFLHVGNSFQCPSDGRFDNAQTIKTPAVGNKPDFFESTLADGIADFRALAALRFLRGVGPRPLDRLAVLLPRMVRDHIPSSYFRAFGVTLDRARMNFQLAKGQSDGTLRRKDGAHYRRGQRTRCCDGAAFRG